MRPSQTVVERGGRAGRCFCRYLQAGIKLTYATDTTDQFKTQLGILNRQSQLPLPTATRCKNPQQPLTRPTISVISDAPHQPDVTETPTSPLPPHRPPPSPPPPTMSKNILLTGGARGLGRGLARHFLASSRQHRVFILDNDAAELSHTVATYTPPPSAPHPPRLGSAICDLASPPSIAAAVQTAITWFGGRIHVLINNGAVTTPTWADGARMEDAPVDEWQRFVATNLSGAFLVARACIPVMVSEEAEPGAAIINISSTRARMSEPNCEGYAATKAGLVGLTHAMAASLAGRGVTVNAVLPGWIEVGMECRAADVDGWKQEHSTEDKEWHWSGRVGTVLDVAKTVEWVLDSPFVNGQEVVVDGGVTRRMVYPE
ncbi:hypothetical protein EDC01DRAFT_485743 [Geopyxis carbonaria]|nr:hypothetical protein EDC01DRAFT_485743 [Geopyxis carbonaria]